MANTVPLNIIKEYIREILSKKYGINLIRKKVVIGKNKEGIQRLKIFDGVSENNDIIITIANNSGNTSGGNNPSGKIRGVFASCYFLSLTKAKRKILVLTDIDFYRIFERESDGLLNDIELIFMSVPSDLQEIAKKVTGQASKEMTR